MKITLLSLESMYEVRFDEIAIHKRMIIPFGFIRLKTVKYFCGSCIGLWWRDDRSPVSASKLCDALNVLREKHGKLRRNDALPYSFDNIKFHKVHE